MASERNELQRDVEGLIMFANQEREYNNVLAMYSRTTKSKNLKYDSVLKFKNPETNETIDYEENLSESAIGYLERNLAHKMSDVHKLSKLKKVLIEKEKLLADNLRTIRRWGRANGIKWKNSNEAVDEED